MDWTADVNFSSIDTNGVRLHVAEAGPSDGPLVVLLHGFPEFWYGWRHQIPILAAAGYQVLVPDQRGYALSSKPSRVRDYRLDLLAADVLGLLDTRGAQRACIVGHDWGAAVAWHLALHHPDRVDRMAILNVPHPLALARTLRHNPRQLARSWYILAFQLPWLPEVLLSRNDWRAMCEAMENSSAPGTFSESDLARYRSAWSEPGAMTAMLNWYRALVRYPPALSKTAQIERPVEIIWGARDRFLEVELAQASADFCDGGRLTMVPEATHWVQHEAADLVNERLLAHFAGH